MRKSVLSWFLVVPVSLSVASLGCDKHEGHEHADGSSHSHEDGDHSHGDESHDDNGHGDDGHDGHSHEGERHELGAIEVGVFSVKVVQTGEVVPGKEALFDLTCTGEAQPAEIRLWVGQEDGMGSMKGKASKEDSGYHAHVDVPRAMADGAKLWIQAEDAEGTMHVASLDYHK